MDEAEIIELLRHGNEQQRRSAAMQSGALSGKVLPELVLIAKADFFPGSATGLKTDEVAILSAGKVMAQEVDSEPHGTNFDSALQMLELMIREGRPSQKSVAMVAIGGLGLFAKEFIPLLRQVSELAGPKSLLSLRALQTAFRIQPELIHEDYWVGVANTHGEEVVHEWLKEDQ